jgi:hypothetical protein
VPLDFPSTYLVKRFKEILDRYHTGKRGEKFSASNNSRAQYLVTTNRIDINFLRTALNVWDARQAHPEWTLVELAMETNVSPNNNINRDKGGNISREKHVANQKAILAATISRYLRKADAAINNVGKGIFPDYSG